MATVARKLDLQARVDRYLEYLVREWQSVPGVAQEWTDWSADEQLEFVLEWPIREDRLGQLRQYAEQGLLTPPQRERYEQLLELVAQHRPTVEALLRE